MSTKFRRYKLPCSASVVASALCVVAIGAAPTLAIAQTVSGQVGLASEYIGKGIGKSNGEPSVLGSAEIGTGQAYASVFASTAELSQGGDSEIITTLGWRPTAGGVKFDLAILNRDLPGTRDGVDSNYFEYQADATRAFGRVTARLRVNYTPDGFAATREAWWVELQAGIALDGKTKATVALANRSADGGAEYVAWNVGVKRKLTDAVSADLRFYDTDGHSFGEAYEGRLVAALTYSF